MKKLFQSVLFVAAIAMAFSSCSKDQEIANPDGNAQGFELKFTVDNQTRTTLGAGDVIKWVKNDELGVFIPSTTPQPTLNRFADVDLTKNPIVFRTFLENKPAVGALFYTYYPRSYVNNDKPITAIEMAIPMEQLQQTADVFCGENNPMVGLPTALTSAELTGITYPAVKFRQLGAMIEFRLYCSNPTFATEKVQSVAFAANKAMAGTFSYDLTSVTLNSNLAISGYTERAITTLLKSAAPLQATNAMASKIYMVVAPGSYSGVVTITTTKAVYTVNVTTEKTFQRAHIKALGIDLAKATREAKPDTGNTITLTQADMATMIDNFGYDDFSFTNVFGMWSGRCTIVTSTFTGRPNSYLMIRFSDREYKLEFNSRIVVPELGGVAQKVVIELDAKSRAGVALCLTDAGYLNAAGVTPAKLKAAAKVSSAPTTAAGATITFDNLNALNMTQFAIFPCVANQDCHIRSITITKK
ncbi:MAG: fimbrillin family protein [Alistipes sp.]